MAYISEITNATMPNVNVRSRPEAVTNLLMALAQPSLLLGVRLVPLLGLFPPHTVSRSSLRLCPRLLSLLTLMALAQPSLLHGVCPVLHGVCPVPLLGLFPPHTPSRDSLRLCPRLLSLLTRLLQPHMLLQLRLCCELLVQSLPFPPPLLTNGDQPKH